MRIAVWIVHLDGEELFEVPYKDKDIAEQFCKDYGNGSYLNMVKKPLEHFGDKILEVVSTTKRIGGVREDNGEGWSKTFYHTIVHSLVKDKYPLETRFVGHRYRGEYRITGVCGSLTLEAFSKWVRVRWPAEWARVYKEVLR